MGINSTSFVLKCPGSRRPKARSGAAGAGSHGRDPRSMIEDVTMTDSYEEDSDNPLVPARDTQNAPYNYFAPIRHDEQMEEPNDSNDESENPTNVVQVTEQISAPRSPRGGRGEIGGRERTRGGGKWPRQKYLFNSSSVLKPAYRKQKCEAENCVHQYGSSCVDILLQPHLYPHISKSKGANRL